MSMVRSLLPFLAVLALGLTATSAWAEEPAAATPGAATEAPAAAEPITLESLAAKLAEVEVQAKTAADSTAQVTFNAGDNAWMLVCTILVLLMTLPGLALFYGGLVRSKNVLSTMMQSFGLAAIVSVIWCICGYSLAFGGDGKFIGSLTQWAFLTDVIWKDGAIVQAVNGDYAMSIPHGTFMLFQMMFAIITPALICGAYAERIKFSGMVVFSVLWLFVVYIPMAHMVWGKGGLFNWGFGATTWAAFDFAGGTVVHISSGIAALMAALVLGKRKVTETEAMRPHNLTLSFIGACLLWVGWFGFNAGSALNASGLATLAFANTHFATAAAAITWPLAEWIIRGKPTVLGAISGAVAGLVAITPAAGFVSPGAALIIGAVAGVICYAACSYLKSALKYDDALDAFGIHGIGGIWGAIATGLFFAVDANPNVAGLNQDLYAAIKDGSHNVLFGQIKAVVITIAFSAVASTVILLVVKYTVGLRVDADQESEGLDLSQHGEEGYHKLV
jgi:Amt family ammonium transporter